jgi:hypothetical protein
MSILLISCFVTGLWDGFTTFYGTSQIMGSDPLQLIASVIFAVIITGFLFGTKIIWESSSSNFLSFLLRSLWLVALGYDLYTSYLGNKNFILSGNVNDDQMIILIGMTILVSGSPIIFSYLSD